MNRFGGKAIAVAVVAAAGVLVTTPSAPARVVAATPPQSVTLTGSQTLVTTSAGRHLTLQIEAIKQVGAQQPVTFGVTLATGEPWHHGETHRWGFDLDRPDLSWDRSAGRARLTTDSELGRFGTMRMVFRQKARNVQSCVAGSRTIVRGTLRGDLVFDTRSRHWGVVGKPSEPFAFSTHPRSRLVIDHGCLRGDYVERRGCMTGVQWTRLLGGAADDAFGLSLRVRDRRNRQLAASRRVRFAHPVGTWRQDSLVFVHQPDPVVRDHRLHVRTKPGAAVRGSASIGRGDVTRTTYDCNLVGGTGTQTSISHSRGRFDSHRLRFGFHVGGVLRVPDGRAGWTEYRSS